MNFIPVIRFRPLRSELIDELMQAENIWQRPNPDQIEINVDHQLNSKHQLQS